MFKTIAIGGIKLYQKFISPHKGYKCAAAHVYGVPSCSNNVMNIIQENGIFGSWPSIKEVFANCKKAASEYEEKRRKNGNNNNLLNACDCGDGCDIGGGFANKCDLPDLGDCAKGCDGPDLGDCGDCGNGCDIGGCDF